MHPAGAIGLLAAGFAGGLAGSVAGLASVASYPALLALGIPPVAANVTNTVALVAATTGSVLGSRPELTGQRDRLLKLSIAGVAGGLGGAALLLATPADAFEAVVPWMIALAAVAILVRRTLVEDAERHRRTSRGVTVAVGLVGIYAGYFGAGAGVMLLALLLLTTGDTVPRCNAVKSFVLGVANGSAAIVFAVIGDVRWGAALPLAIGLFVGGRLGPAVVRRAPPAPLRYAIAIAGLGLAAKLAFWS